MIDGVRLKYLVDRVVVRPSEPLPYVALEHLDKGAGRLLDGYTPDPIDASETTAFKPNDVLFGKLRPYLAKSLLADFRGTCSAELLVLRVRPNEMDPVYLSFLVRSDPFIDWAVATSEGVKMPRTSWEAMTEYRVVAPDIATQSVVAAALDAEVREIDGLISHKGRLIALLAERRHSVLSRAVIGLTHGEHRDTGCPWLPTVPVGWDFRRLKFAAGIQTGITLGKPYPQTDHLERRPFLRVSNVQDGFFKLDDVSTIAMPAEEIAKRELLHGDVLVTEGGDPDKLGRGAVWRDQIPECLHQNHVFAVRPHVGLLDPEFLAAILSSSYGRAYFTATANQTTNLASTNGTILMDLPIPLPSLDEQRDILSRVGAVLESLDRLVEVLNEQMSLLAERKRALITNAVTSATQAVA